MDKHPKSYSEWTDRSSKLLEQGKYQEALEAAEEALKIRPDYASALVTKARALNALERPEQGLASCDQAS
jgi:tetratricopeptide (TPR) repeat protein